MNELIANNIISFLCEERNFVNIWNEVAGGVDPDTFITPSLEKLEEAKMKTTHGTLEQCFQREDKSTVFLLGLLIGVATQMKIKEKV